MYMFMYLLIYAFIYLFVYLFIYTCALLINEQNGTLSWDVTKTGGFLVLVFHILGDDHRPHPDVLKAQSHLLHGTNAQSADGPQLAFGQRWVKENGMVSLQHTQWDGTWFVPLEGIQK